MWYNKFSTLDFIHLICYLLHTWFHTHDFLYFINLISYTWFVIFYTLDLKSSERKINQVKNHNNIECDGIVESCVHLIQGTFTHLISYIVYIWFLIFVHLIHYTWFFCSHTLDCGSSEGKKIVCKTHKKSSDPGSSNQVYTWK